ncbi:MAG: hypothetical protein M0P71_13600 [Melioribacteraceae bacterium]|nr:hypothetical protein [Melioribacteraceae bacterium]
MNKRTLIFLTIILSLTFTKCTKSQESVEVKKKVNTENLKKYEFKNQDLDEIEKSKIKKIKKRTKYAAFITSLDNIPERKTLTEEVFFNKKGERIKLIRYKTIGTIDLLYTYDYDKKGNLIHSLTVTGDDLKMSEIFYKYNKQGKEIERKVYDKESNGLTSIQNFYDKNGNVVETKTFNSNGVLYAHEKNEYLNDVIVKKTVYDDKGGKKQESTYEYLPEGKGYIEIAVNAQGQMRIENNFDEKGNPIRIENNMSKRFMQYDPNGNLMQDELFLPDGSRQFKVRFNYLPNGLQNEQIRYTGEDKPAFYTVYEYEYYK